MANWTVFIPGRGNIVVDGTEEDLNKTLEQYAQSRGASQEKQQSQRTRYSQKLDLFSLTLSY